VGVIGFPNAGKSTLVSRLSAAKPKIADYPFTTLVPNLGVVSAGDDTFVVADIPGLIEGAHEGHGLGDRFLKHVERCVLLVHLVDLSQTEDPRQEAEVIERELARYSEMLGSKRRIVCGSKLDSAVEGASENLRKYADERGYPYVEISAVVGTGIEKLKFRLAEMVSEIRREDTESADAAV
jgi:GTP-binding protein